MRRSAWQTLAVALAFLLALACVFLFAARTHRRFRQIRSGTEPIRAWMSVPFIAHAHHVPVSALFQAIGVEPRLPRDRRSVRRIARETNRPVAELMHELENAIDAAHGAHAPPGEPPR